MSTTVDQDNLRKSHPIIIESMKNKAHLIVSDEWGVFVEAECTYYFLIDPLEEEIMTNIDSLAHLYITTRLQKKLYSLNGIRLYLKGCLKINCIQIEHDKETDLHKMKFFHANSSDSSNASLRLIAEHEDVYPHHLGRIIESETKFEGPLCG
jgi:hypothetical protein